MGLFIEGNNLTNGEKRRRLLDEAERLEKEGQVGNSIAALAYRQAADVYIDGITQAVADTVNETYERHGIDKRQAVLNHKPEPKVKFGLARSEFRPDPKTFIPSAKEFGH